MYYEYNTRVSRSPNRIIELFFIFFFLFSFWYSIEKFGVIGLWHCSFVSYEFSTPRASKGCDKSESKPWRRGPVERSHSCDCCCVLPTKIRSSVFYYGGGEEENEERKDRSRPPIRSRPWNSCAYRPLY